MTRVERHIILNDKNLDELTHLSKNLYNYTNYILRQVYIQKFDNLDEDIRKLIKSFEYNNKTYYKIDEYDLTTYLIKINQIDFRALPTHTSQQIIKSLYKNWKSFYKTIKSYWQNKDKFTGVPKLPKYKKKDGHYIVIFTVCQAKLKEGFICFPKRTKIEPLKTKVNNIKQVRIIPKASHNIIEIIYEKEKINHENLDNNLYLGIDLGVNNLVSTSNNAELNSFIVNGKVLKSMNQFYNKKKAKLMSFVNNKGTSNRLKKLDFKRNNKVSDYMHKTSRFIINYCIQNNIKNIVVGYNKDWKRNIEIGKVNNQKFVMIPYQKLINQLEYKAEENGINVKLIEESHTSKCSALDNESIEKHKEYSGKRIKRGLFRSSKGKLINADVNAAINILRKVIDDDLLKIQSIEGLVFSPIKINIF